MPRPADDQAAVTDQISQDQLKPKSADGAPLLQCVLGLLVTLGRFFVDTQDYNTPDNCPFYCSFPSSPSPFPCHPPPQPRIRWPSFLCLPGESHHQRCDLQDKSEQQIQCPSFVRTNSTKRGETRAGFAVAELCNRLSSRGSAFCDPVGTKPPRHRRQTGRR